MVAVFSKEGLKKKTEELAELYKELSINAEKVDYARQFGDLSENAEYTAAKNALDKTRGKIRELENILKSVTVEEDGSNDNKDFVDIFAHVEIKNIDTNDITKYILVSEEEAKFSENEISTSSPIGRNLIGKKVNEEVEIKTPKGNILRLKILDIKYKT